MVIKTFVTNEQYPSPEKSVNITAVDEKDPKVHRLPLNRGAIKVKALMGPSPLY